jgi:hypothetical protein
MVHYALLVSSAQHKSYRGIRFDNGTGEGKGSKQGWIAVWYNEINTTTGVCITMSDGKAMIDGSRTQPTL